MTGPRVPAAFLLAFLLAACAPAPYEPPVFPDIEGDSVTNVKLETTKGDVVLEVHSGWAPHGAERFLALVREGYYDGCRFYRVLPGFVAQWGISGNAERNAFWDTRVIADDKRNVPNARGTVSFAAAGRDTRTALVFVNLADNSYKLDLQNYAPFARVVSGFDVLTALESKYENEPTARQAELMKRGNDWIDETFPRLDHIVSAKVVGE